VDRTYWHKQLADKPLFPDLQWSRPENKAHAGKLGIIGGNAFGFSAAAEAYGEALKAGVGAVRVLLPNSLQKTVGKVFEAGEYAPSTPSGSFSQQALADMLELANWADALLLAGDFGHNSETAIVLEKLITDYHGQLGMCGDSIDYFMKRDSVALKRSKTLVIPNFSQLQKLAAQAGLAMAFTSSMGLVKFVEGLHQFTTENSLHIVTSMDGSIVVAVNGQVSTTKYQVEHSYSQLASYAATWWLQNPSKSFEAISTAALQLGG